MVQFISTETKKKTQTSNARIYQFVTEKRMVYKIQSAVKCHNIYTSINYCSNLSKNKLNIKWIFMKKNLCSLGIRRCTRQSLGYFNKWTNHFLGISFFCSYCISKVCGLQVTVFNPLNAEFNSICHLLAFLGTRHILHVSRIRVKSKVTQELLEFSTHFLNNFRIPLVLLAYVVLIQ